MNIYEEAFPNQYAGKSKQILKMKSEICKKKELRQNSSQLRTSS